jgi:hypothetical protein
MPTFTTELANRTTRELPLTLAEASQMAEAGFKFAEFDPEYGRYRLSRPYELVIYSAPTPPSASKAPTLPGRSSFPSGLPSP